MSKVEPSRYLRRSFVYQRLIDAGAEFAEVHGSAMADAFPGRGGLPDRLALADLSPLPRSGYKGPGVMAWLSAQGLTPPDANNRARIGNDGVVVARLADTEALLLPDLARIRRGAFKVTEPNPDTGCFPAPRRDSHAWFMLTGRLARCCLAKLCGIDLRLEKFVDLSVAQTSAARLSTVIIRQDLGGTPAFHLLADSASALYFWDVLTDAMQEHHGGPIGLRALEALAAGRRQAESS